MKRRELPKTALAGTLGFQFVRARTPGWSEALPGEKLDLPHTAAGARG